MLGKQSLFHHGRISDISGVAKASIPVLSVTRVQPCAMILQACTLYEPTCILISYVVKSTEKFNESLSELLTHGMGACLS